MRRDRPDTPRDRDPRVLLARPLPTLRPALPAVVASKLVAPSTATLLLDRPRLDAELDRATRRPLTLVHAPAGSGRTTALRLWAATAASSCAWLTLDEGDDDPRRLSAHLLAALERAAPGSTRIAARALWAGHDPERGVLPLVVRSLTAALSDGPPPRDGRAPARPPGAPGPSGGRTARPADRRLVLVLDDAHRLRSDAGWRLLRALVDGLPAGLSVVVSGRTLPPLRCARRRAEGRLSTVGADELAFTSAETDRLLRELHGSPLDDGAVRAARERAAGWATGLALLADLLPAGADPARAGEALEDAEAAIAVYVEEEILAPADAGLARLLRRASVLEHPSPAACAALLEDPAAAGRVARAREAGLLTGRPDHERWRAPFGAALRLVLQTREPELLDGLRARAPRPAAGRDGAGSGRPQIAAGTDRGRTAPAVLAVGDRSPAPDPAGPARPATGGRRTAEVAPGSDPSPAELRLLALLPSGLSRREIGAELFISVDTVKTHLRRLYRRLGVATRADAVAVARQRGFLPRRP